MFDRDDAPFTRTQLFMVPVTMIALWSDTAATTVMFLLLVAASWTINRATDRAHGGRVTSPHRRS